MISAHDEDEKMSAIQQSMIAAPDANRTGSAMFFGYPTKSDKSKPAQWVNWAVGGPTAAETTFRVAREKLGEALSLESGERILNVTAGTADAASMGESMLPFRTAAFDVVMSGFGAIYADNHFGMAKELLRVARPGGRIGMTCWTPDGFDGGLILLMNRYMPQGDRPETAAWWGTRDYLNALFGHSADALGAADCTHTWRAASPEAWLSAARAAGGRLAQAYCSVDPDWHDQLSAEILALVNRFNEADDGSMLVRSDYIEFLVHKSTWR